MTTVSGFGSSLWSKKQGGLLSPSRKVIPPNGLVIYSPFWHPELSGASFSSKEPAGKTLTATGTTQGIQGRSFNGTTDWISIPTDANLNSVATTGEETLIVWFKTSDRTIAYQGMMSAGNNSAGSPIPYDFYLKAGKLYLQINDGVGWTTLVATTQVSNDTWYMGTVSFKDSTNACEFYLNAVSDKSGTMNTSLVASTFATNGIGADGDGGSPFKGTIGECLLYNRIFTLAEIINLYLATKWRYS